MKEMSSLEKKINSNIWQISRDEQGKGITISETNFSGDELGQVTQVGVLLRQ